MTRWTRLGLGALAAIVLGCGRGASSDSPSAPSSSAGQRVQLDLPLAIADTRNAAYGIWPFGVHGGGHALDGHPGFDFEFALGARALAAAEGSVDNVIPDQVPGRKSVQLRTPCVGGDCFVSYTNLEQVPADVVPGAHVTRGQVLGVAGAYPLDGPPVFAMIHFQVGDPAVHDAGSVVASPETYFTPAGRAAVETIWHTARYNNEWCEPFMTNSRAILFPMSRVWTRSSGAGPAEIRINCVDNPSAYTYAFLDSAGATVETGALRFTINTPATTADFISSRGDTQLALFDILDTSMHMALGAVGESRPASLAGAGVYTTIK